MLKTKTPICMDRRFVKDILCGMSSVAMMTASWFADKIEQWRTANLLSYARNVRTCLEDQLAQIAASIAELSFTCPILMGSDGVIVAGHGRPETLVRRWQDLTCKHAIRETDREIFDALKLQSL